jgi:hypothetical protein
MPPRGFAQGYCQPRSQVVKPGKGLWSSLPSGKAGGWITCTRNHSHVGGNMTTKGIPRPLSWRELYHVAMLESDQTKLPPLLDDAISAVLDQIEGTITYGELDELNNALNCLRSRRRAVTRGRSGRTGNSDEPKAA